MGIVGGDTPRDVLGLMMAGMDAQEAAAAAAEARHADGEHTTGETHG
jgi:hypothetical protein